MKGKYAPLLDHLFLLDVFTDSTSSCATGKGLDTERGEDQVPKREGLAGDACSGTVYDRL